MKFSYRKDAVSGVKWTGLSTVIITAGNLLFILYLTQVLTKVDFGLFALVNVVAVLASEFVDMGIGQAIIQKKEVNRDQLSTLYWINLSLGLLVTATVFLISGPVARFYESPDLIPLIQWTSIGFFAGAIGSQFQALFQRELLFKRMAFIDLTAFVVYVSVTVYFVYLGYGVFGLIWGGLARVGVKTLVSILLGAAKHMPKFYFNYGPVKSFISFGSFRSASFLLSYFGSQLDAILIGKLIGIGELGIYDVLKRLVVQPMKIISPLIKKVVFPILSKVQEDRSRASSIFKKVLQLLNLMRFPIFLGIALGASEITTFLGEEWSGYYIILQILCLIYLLNTIQTYIGQTIVAMGKSSWGFYNNLGQLPLRIVAIFVGSNWGLTGIAVGLLIFALVIIVPRYFIFVRRLYDLSFGNYMIMIFKEFIILGLWAALIDYTANYFEMDLWMAVIYKSVVFTAGVLILYRTAQREQWDYLLKLLRG